MRNIVHIDTPISILDLSELTAEVYGRNVKGAEVLDALQLGDMIGKALFEMERKVKYQRRIMTN